MTKIGLVLGAGGLTGFGFHAGALSSMRSVTGWDPRTAEIIVGTSSGSGVGSLLRGGVPVSEVAGRMLAAPTNSETMARLRAISDGATRWPAWGLGSSSPSLAVKETFNPFATRMARLGAALLPDGRVSTAIIGDRARELHGDQWPEDDFWACAVRLSDGDRVVFGQDRVEADVGSAVEASSAVPGMFQPVLINGVRHVDGAIHSPTNADLLVDRALDLIVVVSPMSAPLEVAMGALDAPMRMWSAHRVSSEVRLLRAAGHTVLVLEPNRDDTRSMGPLPMDPTRIVPTILQAATSTALRLSQRGFADCIELLREAARTEPGITDVAYPGSTTPVEEYTN